MGTVLSYQRRAEEPDPPSPFGFGEARLLLTSHQRSPVMNPPDQPVRIEVQTGDRTSTIWIGEGIVDRLSALLDAHGVGARRFVVSSPVIWQLPRRADAAGARRRRADPHPRRRALQEPAVGLADLRSADPRRRRPRQRHRSPSAAASSATPRASPPPRSCAASRSCTCRRRCWRRWTARSAARSASTTRSART